MRSTLVDLIVAGILGINFLMWSAFLLWGEIRAGIRWYRAKALQRVDIQ